LFTAKGEGRIRTTPGSKKLISQLLILNCRKKRKELPFFLKGIKVLLNFSGATESGFSIKRYGKTGPTS
jgi:hypothetical protein